MLSRIERSTSTEANVDENAKKLAESSWKTVNYAATVVGTCATVVLLKNPIDTVIVNLMKHGKVIPTAILNEGSLAVLKHAYAGLAAGAVGQGARTTYVINAKKGPAIAGTEASVEEAAISAEESALEGGISKKPNYGWVAAVAAGDVLINIGPNNLSMVQKANPKTPIVWWNPANMYRLGTTGIVASYCSALVNFWALCALEDKVSAHVPIANPALRHTVAGAASGMFAGFASLPFGYLKDARIVHATVENGKIKTPSLKGMATDLLGFVKKEGVAGTVGKVAKEVAIQALPRSLKVGAAMAGVSGVGALLGDHPLGEKPPAVWCSMFQPAKATPASDIEMPDLSMPDPSNPFI
jgi:hypothetical protein